MNNLQSQLMELLELPFEHPSICKNYPNDSILGEEYRSSIGHLDDNCIKYPNDSDLGGFLRSLNQV